MLPLFGGIRARKIKSDAMTCNSLRLGTLKLASSRFEPLRFASSRIRLDSTRLMLAECRSQWSRRSLCAMVISNLSLAALDENNRPNIRNKRNIYIYREEVWRQKTLKIIIVHQKVRLGTNPRTYFALRFQPRPPIRCPTPSRHVPKTKNFTNGRNRSFQK